MEVKENWGRLSTEQLISQLLNCDNEKDGLDVALALFERAKKGDIKAIEFILEKVYGRP